MPIIYSSKELRPRQEHDFYPTPIELCRAALRFIPLKRAYVLDAGAGDGTWGKALKEIYPTFVVDGVDIRNLEKPDGYEDWYYSTDYLDFNPPFKYDYVIGNPPYKYAEEFIWHSKELLMLHGNVIFLLPLSFMESVKRGRGLFTDWPPYEIMVSMRRISFTGNGKSDNTAYAVYKWQNSYVGKTEVTWMDWEYDKHP
jgi:hypothetical protein